MEQAQTLTNNFLKRFNNLVEFLQTREDVELKTAKTAPPVSEKEIEKVEKILNHKLDETFLSYFRESNGYELKYKLFFGDKKDKDNFIRGSIEIPSLAKLFKEPILNISEEGEYNLEILGGRDDYEFRKSLYLFDQFDKWRDKDNYYGFYYSVPDNLVLLSSDYEACITDAHPITIQSYFELCLASVGLESRRKMLERGCAGNYEIVNFSLNDYEVLNPWNKELDKVSLKNVSPEFYFLTVKATANKGHALYYILKDFEENEQHEALAECYDWYLKLYPNDFEYWLRLGLCYEEIKGMESKAMDCYLASVKCDESYALAWAQISTWHADRGDLQKAIDTLNTFHSSHAGDSTSWECLADWYTKTGNKEETYKAFEKAITFSPSNGQLYNSLGFRMIKWGDASLSKKYLQKAIEFRNKYGAFNLGHAHLIEGKEPAAVLSYKKALKDYGNKDKFSADYDSDFVLLEKYGITKEKYDEIKKMVL